MDLHRLKVVKFDRSLEKNSIIKGIIKDHEKKTHCANINASVINGEEHISADTMELKSQRLFNIHKSESEPLKRLPKDKSFRKHVRKTAISFDDIKKHFIYKNNLFKPVTFSNLKEATKFIERNKEIKVLFASEAHRLTKRNRNVCCSTKRRNNKVGTFTKKTNPSFDVFGFQNRKCSFENVSKQYRCDKGCITKKFSKLQSNLNKIHKLSQQKKEPKSVLIQHKPLKFLKSCTYNVREVKSAASSCACTRAQHYNLVCFPENNHSARRGKTIANPKNIPVYPAAYFPNCICVNEQVSVTPSRLQVRKKNVGDAAVATSCSLCDTCTNIKPTRANKASEPFCRICKIPNSIRKRHVLRNTFRGSKKIFPNYKSSRNIGNKIGIFLKCILLGLAFIAWIPCIITVVMCWILTYPFRPQYVKTSGCENDDCLRKQTLQCHIIGGVKCLADKAAYSIRAMLSLLRSHKKQDDLQYIPTTRWRGWPDPKRKYTLFYTDNRGWRMKPICEKNLDAYDREVQGFPDQTQDTPRKKKFVKYKCRCKLHKVAKGINMDTSLYRLETKNSQRQNGKQKFLYKLSQKHNGEEKYLEHKDMIRPRIKSKSHPWPYDFAKRIYEKPPAKYQPGHRNSQSLLLSLNNTIANHKHKSRLTHHKMPNCCDFCERKKQHYKISNEMNHCCYNKIKKLHLQSVDSKHRKKKKSYFKRLWNYIRCSCDGLQKVIDETEDVAWKDEIKCDIHWLISQRKQFPWLYQHCPWLYPCFTVWFNCIKSTWHMAVCTLSFCVWCPVMLACYVFSELFWKCFK